MDRVNISGSNKISLCVLMREDVPDIWKIISDPGVNRFLHARWRLHYLEKEYEWYETLMKNSDTERAFGIVLSGESRIAGVVFLNGINYRNGFAHVGYFLGREHWGKGIMTEAMRLIKHYSFGELKLRKLISSAFEPNQASIRVLEKSGFSSAGRYRKHIYVPDMGYVDELKFEIFSEEDQRGPGKE